LVEFTMSTKHTQQFSERSRKEISSEAKSKMDRSSSTSGLHEKSFRDRFMVT
jgi:hypothetical protein